MPLLELVTLFHDETYQLFINYEFFPELHIESSFESVLVPHIHLTIRGSSQSHDDMGVSPTDYPYAAQNYCETFLRNLTDAVFVEIHL